MRANRYAALLAAAMMVPLMSGAHSTDSDAESPPAVVQGPPDATVVYEDGGFEPGRLDIEPGDTVRFVNESGRDVWPASHIHPTHQIYPAFDPQRPVGPGQSWLFTFDRTGFWRYHNHLSPDETALVVVSGQDQDAQQAPLVVPKETPDFEPLGTVTPRDAAMLFRDDELLEEYIVKYGPDVTIELLAENESLVGDCHQQAHVAGRIAYEKFGAVAFSLAGHECHSGGYHGATEALFRERGTVNLEADIQAVCTQELNPFFRHQCIHGIGHGLMAWTSYEIFDALALCDKLPSERDQSSCHSGVFMENVVGGLSGSMGHKTEYVSDDPHYPCNVLAPKHVPACYYYQTSRMVQLFDGRFSEVAAACAEAPQSSRELCFRSMGRDVGGVTRSRPAEAIRNCGFVTDPQFRRDCLAGAVQDWFWDTGGADDALAFCDRLANEAAASRCYATIVDRAQYLYATSDGLRRFCSRVPERYRRDCSTDSSG